MLEVSNLTREFRSGKERLRVLDDVSFTLEAGATCAVVGPSGSGKSTLLGLCAGLDAPTAGGVVLAGKELAGLDEDERAALRNRETGFVFQNFQLIPTLTALENVMVPLEMRGGAPLKTVRERARELLAEVGLADRETHYPVQLSGGEQQRVALARAFINRPSILFADEPNGNLDGETSARVTDLLFSLNEKEGTALVLVTHDLELAERTGRLLRLKRGRLESDESTTAAAGDPAALDAR
ncbi:MAG: ABC transporter ATP-binding protein [Puniceicoccaceae bacterium]|nr:MAG: ABC transporter ATP-binding protein [Puniceicoccaceae bacterium]